MSSVPTVRDPYEEGGLLRSRVWGGRAVGWAPKMRHRFGYVAPEHRYQLLLDDLVGENTAWLDVGCGATPTPGNDALARRLADRCARMVGVDPGALVLENPYVHERVRAPVEDYRAEAAFDLITLRMVAEHVADPDAAVASLARLLRPGGKVVVYTTYRWSPAPIVAGLLPVALRRPCKRLLWGDADEDAYPVVNRMNTRGALRKLFEGHGLVESDFRYLDDCRTFGGLRASFWLELSCWRLLHAVGLHYPEVCLLGVYSDRDR